MTVKILMLTPRFPFPPSRGDCIRAWGELAWLADRHDLWLASLAETPPSRAELDEVRRRCRGLAVFARGPLTRLFRGGSSFLGGATITEGYFADGRLAAHVRSWAAEIGFDATLAFSSGMAQYTPLAGAARSVLDMNDVDSFKWRRYSRTRSRLARGIYAVESRRLAAAERDWSASHDVTVVVNERERSRLAAIGAPGRSAVIRTGVEAPSAVRAPRRVPEQPIVGFVGSMSYPPNIRAVQWFAEAVWPGIRAARPDAQWWIVGRSPTRAVRRLARLPGVTVVGAVECVTPLLAQFRVFVAPIRDDLGVQTKLIHALAHGVPSVCTPAAADGMDWDARPPFIVAASPAEFAAAVTRVLADDALAADLSSAAIQNAAAFYDVPTQAAELEALLMSPPADGREAAPAGQPIVLAPSTASRLAG